MAKSCKFALKKVAKSCKFALKKVAKSCKSGPLNIEKSSKYAKKKSIDTDRGMVSGWL